MMFRHWVWIVAVFLFRTLLHGQCVNDHRSDKNGGILISDFTITGTQTISTTELARITSDMIGSCYDEDSDEMGDRVRASFQDRGYFSAEVKSLRFKPRDPLGVPKAVILDGEVSEGPRYKLGQVTFVANHAFAAEELRQQFPLKKGALVERDKIASGLQSLSKLYAASGYLDCVAIPETESASNATLNLHLTIEEGPQYHMGKLDIVAEKEPAARLRTEWKLTEGDVYDNTYIDKYLATNSALLPGGFSRADIQTIRNCPDALIHVRLIVDPAQATSHPELKNIFCEEPQENPK
jgi:outer membrane protein assembly factor BamA